MEFTYDWFSSNIPVWSRALIPLYQDIETHAIELGCFEGRSTVWLLENVLNHPKSIITCVDTWQGGVKDDRFGDIDWQKGKERFLKNIEKYKDKVNIKEESTFSYMKYRTENSADLIYVDAGHLASDALIDGVQSHLVLKRGGILIFDDYLWTQLESKPDTPKPAIDAFMTCFAREYTLISLGYQVILRKN